MTSKLVNIPIQTMTTNKIFELILMPTEQCNFRCTYCYEDFTIGRMRQDVIDGVKNLIQIRSQELKLLKISWFGGEPLSAKSVVFDIASYAKNLAEHHGFKISSSMTTNAYHLSTTVMEKLLNVNINQFQISLDGSKEYHDKSRLRINGSGSFDKIWHNIGLLAKSNLKFNIILRIHLTQDNLVSIPTLINQLNCLLKGDARFKIFFKAVENLGGEGVKSVNIINHMEQREIIQRFKNMSNICHVDVGGEGCANICYASYLNSLVVRADGRIAKCTVAFNDEKNVVGQLNKDGRITFNKKKLNLWVDGMFSGDAAYLACPYSQIKKYADAE